MKEQEKKEELYNEGYRPFEWGDFWKTGYGQRAALKVGRGFRVDGSHLRRKDVRWETIPGPRGGTWIKYYRADSR